MTFDVINHINSKFYFGIGGIGDFLLLMATFYGDTEGPVDVVFVCNNVNPIHKMCKMFPSVNRFWLYPRSSFETSAENWDLVAKSELCLGTGVTPKKFDYVGDWVECGKTNCFDYYGVKKIASWALPRRISTSVVIQPFGGADDPTKEKSMGRDEVEVLVDKYLYEGYDVKLMGSKSDIDRLGNLDTSIVGASWIVDFEECFYEIINCIEYVGTDSWGKTLAGLSGKKNITIYPNRYKVSPEQLFGHPVDPSDYVFLKDWGFRFADGRNF